MGVDREYSQREIFDKLQEIVSAFPKDELGNPDFSGHRRFHKEQVHAQENFEASRRKIISNIMSWAAIGLLTVLGSALAPYIAKLILP